MSCGESSAVSAACPCVPSVMLPQTDRHSWAPSSQVCVCDLCKTAQSPERAVHGPATSESVEPQGAVASAQCGATGVRRDRSSFRARRPWPHAPRPSTHDGGSIHDSDSFHTLSHLCSLRHTDTLSALSTTQITHIDTTHQTSFSGAPSCPVRAAWSLEPIPSAISVTPSPTPYTVHTVTDQSSQF